MGANPEWLAAGTVCGASAAFAWGAVAPSSQLFGPTIRRTGNPSTVALTFDDGPNPSVTPSLLDLLHRHSVCATFFLIGRWVRGAQSIATEIAARGHVVGNHTDTHPALTFLSADRIGQELDRCDKAVKSVMGRKPRWMRPPFGFRSPMLAAILRKHGEAPAIMWSRMAYDWKPQAAEPVIHRLRRVRGGDIVLLHDGDHRVPNGDRRHTVEALEHWLPRWKDAGLRFVTLDEIAPAG
ncbi:MAG TPA: polysaccharide deacetylase family protein [Verrucomicrobiae bacterium]|nr:polysaccharide deacetylase family protein [Verrucomicrobiae bacterium]